MDDPAIDSLVDGASWELVAVEMLSRLSSDKTAIVAVVQKEKLSTLLVSAAED
jgi:hypothetical protein